MLLTVTYCNFKHNIQKTQNVKFCLSRKLKNFTVIYSVIALLMTPTGS